MKLGLRHVLVFVCVNCAIRIFGQEYDEEEDDVSRPLPAADPQLVDHFRLALEAVFGVGIRLQAFLEDDNNENFLVSPISSAVIIGQLILGAEGEFRKQLVELLSLPNSHLYENEKYSNRKKNVTYYFPYLTLHMQLSNLFKALESGTGGSKHFLLSEKNAVFMDNNVQLNDTFKKALLWFYETEIYKLNFAESPVIAQKKVNDWVTVNTNGLIKSILPGPPPPSTLSIFANAIYFKGEWRTPFSDMLNRKDFFNVTATKQVQVTYMANQFEGILYAESKDYRVICLPYTNDEVGMYIILPTNDNPFKYDMKSFVRNLSTLELIETIDRGQRRQVVVKMPKMSISHTFSLIEQLKKYRIFKKQHIRVNSTNVVDKLQKKVDAFSNFTTNDEKDIVLTSATLGRVLRVDDIVQKVVISVNEKGTEAAAVSAATINYIGGAKNFRVERPFLFFIRHEATGAALFWGTVSNPAAV